MNVKAWQVVAVIVVFFGASAIALRIFGNQDAQFSAREEALQHALEPRLESLVIAKEDLSSLPGDFYDCTQAEVTSGYDYDFRLDRDGDSGEFRDAKIVDSEYTRIALSQYCDDLGAEISSLLWLPTTKEDVLHSLRVYSDLAAGDSEDLTKLVEANIDYYYPDTPWSNPSWIRVPTLGSGGYAFKYTLNSADGPEGMVVHDFTFIRGVVYATVIVRLLENEASAERATDIARALDDKIKDQIQGLSAEVQTR